MPPFYGVPLTQSPGYGCTFSTFAMMASSPCPCLLLEDDSILQHNGDLVLMNVPDDADAVYLGTSAWGVLGGESKFKNLHMKPASGGYFKIRGMTSTHSVLYLSQTYVSDILNRAVATGGKQLYHPLDNLIADVQGDYNVYALPEPWFYQKCPHNESVTKYPLRNLYRETHP